MGLDFGFFYNSFSVFKFVFSSLVSSLGEHFNTVIYFAIICASVSTIFGLGVSIYSSSVHRKQSIDVANSKKDGN